MNGGMGGKARIIIHVDMDAFYASVEARDRPHLRGKPVIVGARPGERGVVATCSYEARAFGVRSGMNIQEAFRLCPYGAFIRPDHAKYERVSEELHSIWDPYATVSEPMALDETYLDVTETAVTFERARVIAREIKRRTLDEMGLKCSVGLSYCKAAAKAASEEMKPDGYYEIRTPEEYSLMMSDRPVGGLYFVGPSTERKLRDMGIEIVSDILDHREEVERILGHQGRFLVGLAQGIDDRDVVPYRPEDSKSISRETTLQKDATDYLLLMDILLLMSVDVWNRAEKYGLKGGGVMLKVCYTDGKAVTRNSNNLVICSPMDVAHSVWSLLDGSGRDPVRRIGLALTNLSNPKGRQTTLIPVGNDSDSEEELLHHLARMGRRYRYDFLASGDGLFGKEKFYELVERMRRESSRRTRSK